MRRLLAACVVVAALAGGPAARAALKAEPAAIDFGARRQDQTLVAEVTLTNPDAAPIDILEVLPDCSCTAGTLEKSRLGPGESTRLHLTLATRGYTGVLHRGVRLQTSAGDLEIPMTVTVTLFKNWLMDPTTVVLPPSQKGAEAAVNVTFTHTGPGEARLGKITCDPDWLKAESVRVDDRTVRVRFTKGVRAPAGNHAVAVRVTTSAADEPRLDFKVFVPVVSALRIAPNPIILPSVPVGGETAREIVIEGWTHSAPPRLELPRGTATPPVEKPDGWHFEVRVKPAEPGPSTQLLRVYSDDGLEAEVPVIARATVR